MLPDIGASELMVIALVALIFVGPKDLPVMLKKLGQFTAKLRSMASDFRASFDDMARQSELEDLRREVEQMRANATSALSDPGDVSSTLNDTFNGVDEAVMADNPYGDPYAEPVVETVQPVKAKAPGKAAASKAGAKASAPKKAQTSAKTSARAKPAAKAKPEASKPSAAPTRKRAPKAS